MRSRVAILVSRFPKLSETFILDEVLGLERLGHEVRVHTFLRERDSLRQPESDRLARDGFVLRERIRAWIPEQLRWLVRRPTACLAIWTTVLRAHATSPGRLMRAVVAVLHGMVLARELERSGSDHLHAHWATHTALAAWAVGRLTGLPYSFATHADDLYLDPPMLAEKVREASFVVTISDFNRRLLVERLGDSAREKVRVVRCGVSTGEFAALPPKASADPFVVVCVARLEAKKGHRVLLEACAKLRARGVRIRCRLVGEGPERPALEAMVEALALGDAVELLGRQPRSRVAEILAAAHVMALPCVVLGNGRADGIPVALMEALAMQRPVVATRVTGVPELIVSGETGLLVDPGDAAALADALERVRTEPAAAARRAVAGRRRVEEAFDLDRNVAALSALIEGAASSSIRSRPVGPEGSS